MSRRVWIRRAYEPPSRNDGFRVLVDRVWPRGVSKDDLHVDAWLRELAPSTELRTWFGHDPSRWTEFTDRYRRELGAGGPELARRLNELVERASRGRVTLVYGARDERHNNAVALRQIVDERLRLGRWAKPTLTGELVTLRPIGAGDIDAMWEALHDPESNDLTDTTATFTIEQIADWCATRAEQDERLDLAIIENATGEYAGEVVLNEYDAEHNQANFRIGLRGPAWFGRGLGTEATRLIVDHGFAVVGLDAITLGVLARNPRAQRAYEKAGFVRTGTSVEDGQEWIDMSIHRPADVPPTS